MILYYCTTVPCNTLILSVCGCRILSSVGCVLTMIGVVASAFASQLWHLIVALSLIGGQLMIYWDLGGPEKAQLLDENKSFYSTNNFHKTWRDIIATWFQPFCDFSKTLGNGFRNCSYYWRFCVRKSSGYKIVDTGLVILHIWPALCMAHTDRPTNVINECLLVLILSILWLKNSPCAAHYSFHMIQ